MSVDGSTETLCFKSVEFEMRRPVSRIKVRLAKQLSDENRGLGYEPPNGR